MNELAFNPALAQAGSGLFDFLHEMKGPDFLGLFFGWFILVFGVVLIVRWRGHDSPAISLMGLLCFETLGVARIAGITAPSGPAE